MGIVNVTPDSFSDGGRYLAREDAIRHGLQLAKEGADIVDVGGESTRPGSAPITIAQELARVIPVIEQLTQQGVIVSIDTMHAEVAEQAINAGATIVNDVTGGIVDPDIIKVIVNNDITYIASHYRAPAGSPDTHINPLKEVVEELAQHRDYLLNKGVNPDKLILDPGLGFAKNANTNWAILNGLEEIVALGHRVLIGASRKRFLKELVSLEPPSSGMSLVNQSLDQATAAVTALAVANGAWGVRVHNVIENRIARDVAAKFTARP
jgi:dihydropteroate synthase